MSCLLSCLAITDNFTLITILVPSVTGRDVRFLRLGTDAMCGVMFYAHYVSIVLSIWSLILVTYGRLLGVVFPIWARVNITKSRAVAVWFITILIWIALYFPYLFGIRLKQPDDALDVGLSYTCAFKENFESYLFGLQRFRANFMTIIAFFLISFGSTFILIFVRRNKVPYSTEAPENAINSLSICLFTNNLFFFLTNAPVFIMQIILIHYKHSIPFSLIESINIRDIVVFLNNLNYSLNFVLYFISGSLLRQVIKIVLGIIKP